MALYPHLVVIVPGILGSVLRKDGKPLWEFSLHALGGALGGSYSSLALSQPGTLDEDLGDGVVATEVLSNIEAVPGLWKVGGYTRLQDRLAELDGLTVGKNLWTFPYDWRRDIRVPARQLARQSADELRRWREETNNPEAKLVLIAHSMGGLVASYFLECMEGWRDTHTVINIGVPFKGAGEPLRFLANGPAIPAALDKLLLPVKDRLTEIHRVFGTMDSMYQLVPTYRFIQDGTNTTYVHEANIRGVDKSRVLGARDLHEEISAARRSNLEIDAYRGLKVRSIIGIRQPTYQSARLAANFLSVIHSEADGSDAGGDASVPRVSATPIDGSEDIATFVSNSHAALPADDAVFEQLRGILTGSLIDLSKYRDTGGVAKISLLLPDIAVSGEPTRIAAQVSTGLQFLTATITDQTGVTVNIRLFPQGNTFCSDVTLAAGLYWVTASGTGAHSVGNALVVLPGERS